MLTNGFPLKSKIIMPVSRAGKHGARTRNRNIIAADSGFPAPAVLKKGDGRHRP